MKNIFCIALVGAVAGCASSEPKLQAVTKLYPAPAPTAQSTSSEAYVYDQKPLPGQPVLIAPEQAHSVVEKFKTAYGKLNQPRMLLYVNRELVDEKTGMKLIARTGKN